MDAEHGGGRRLGGGEVQDVDLPERPRLVHGERGQGRHVVLQDPVGVGRDGGGVQVGDDDVVVQVHRGADPSRLGPVQHLLVQWLFELRDLISARPAPARPAPDERDLEAGADRVRVDGFAKADDGDDAEIVEHACRRAQGLAGVVVSVSECPGSAASVHRKRRRRSDDGASTVGTHSSSFLL